MYERWEARPLLSWVGRPPPVDANTGQGGGQGGPSMVAGEEAPQVESDLEPLVGRGEEHSTVVEEREEVGERETKWTD